MRLDAKMLSAIENRLDEIVECAERCVKETKISQTEKGGKQEITQFRNLQNMAAATNSVRALQNFIEYQMGRGYLKKEVGERILEDVNERLQAMSKEICDRLKGVDEGQRRLVHMELIRLYLGFFNRKVVAEQKKPES